MNVTKYCLGTTIDNFYIRKNSKKYTSSDIRYETNPFEQTDK